jgi:hypothetical protein
LAWSSKVGNLNLYKSAYKQKPFYLHQPFFIDYGFFIWKMCFVRWWSEFWHLDHLSGCFYRLHLLDCSKAFQISINLFDTFTALFRGLIPFVTPLFLSWMIAAESILCGWHLLRLCTFSK